MKRAALVLLGLIVVVVVGVAAHHHVRVVRHKWRVQAIEDQLYEDVFADFGGGEPVTERHGGWGGQGIGERAGECLGIDRDTRFGFVGPLGVDGLAVEAERVAGYLEGEGWEVYRGRSDDADLLEPPAWARLFLISAVRGSEIIYLRFVQSVALMHIHTNNCGYLEVLITDFGDDVAAVSSFTR